MKNGSFPEFNGIRTIVAASQPWTHDMKIPIIVLLACSALWAQTPTPPKPAAVAAPASTSSSVAPLPELSDLIQRIKATTQKSDSDVARLRIDKWKTDAASKQQAQASSESIRRNLTYAMPDLMDRIQAAPGSLNANFRLYRNLNALFDTFSSLAESAGAFGARDQYDPLAADLTELEHLRHEMADRTDLLAGNNDAELAKLRTQIAASASTSKSTATKVVVNDDDQPKPKKKPKTSQSQSQPQSSASK